MKRVETDTISGQAVKTKRKRTVKIKEAASEFPSEEQVRSKAMEIYHERIRNGEYGTPESDWYEALESLRSA